MTAVATALTLLLTAAASPPEPDWELVESSPLKIRVREKPDSGLREVWAEGELAADVRDIQETLLSGPTFSKFMPYVKESRSVGDADSDGGFFVYNRLDLPWIQSRDFVTKTWVLQRAADDGSGEFRSKWVSVPDKLPSRQGIVRMKVNEGTWTVKPLGKGKSWASFRSSIDPGGWIPGFAANFGSTTGVIDTFSAVEKEARRRAHQRQKETTGKTQP